MIATLFQRKGGLHLIPQVAGSGAQGKEAWGSKSLPHFVCKICMGGYVGVRVGPEISPNTPKDSTAQMDSC